MGPCGNEAVWRLIGNTRVKRLIPVASDPRASLSSVQCDDVIQALARALACPAKVAAALDGVLDGTLAPMPQDETRAFWLPKVASDQGLDLLLAAPPAKELLARGLCPVPGPEFFEKVLRALKPTESRAKVRRRTRHARKDA